LLLQDVAPPYVPSDWHVTTLLPEHDVWPGEHTPVHAPPTHVSLVQADAALQVPFEAHVSTPLPEHVV
jgi:hypothetical protein